MGGLYGGFDSSLTAGRLDILRGRTEIDLTSVREVGYFDYELSDDQFLLFLVLVYRQTAALGIGSVINDHMNCEHLTRRGIATGFFVYVLKRKEPLRRTGAFR
ncbi:hypothetical protein [Poriferisphaera sp. WC338]|uniref:hypothetical protein n=1 Tax=Poriferisphaera sp. WC338 TaxID=3425129 RepID=UPI003D81AF7F